MPKIKLKAIAVEDLKYLDILYDFIDIKICDSFSELLVNDNRIPISDRNTISNYTEELKRYLQTETNKFIILDIYEGANSTIDYIKDKKLEAYCNARQLFLVTSGDLYPNWKFVNIDYFLMITGSEYNQIVAINNLEKIYNTKDKPYKFLFLNKMNRLHRKLMIEKLANTNQLKDALWSDLSNNISLPQHYKDFYNNNLPDLTINQTQHIADWADGTVNPALYRDTYFSIITETNYEYSLRYFTEKIYKSILIGHPFIVVSCAGFYKNLHNQGYKTFGNLIDERFDNTIDLSLRIQQISNSVNTLCKQNLDEFLAEAKEICCYNQQIYLEKLGRYRKDSYTTLRTFFEDIHAENS